MGIPVLILGTSGSGKSASMRNFAPDEIGIFNVASKPLPFRTKMKMRADGAKYDIIRRTITKQPSAVKSFVIDDSQYLMAFEFFDKVAVRGYDKFTEIAVNFRNLIHCVITETAPDVIVYFLHHTDVDEHGTVKAKTVGKMLDQQLTVEGLFSIVMRTKVEDGKYRFVTQTNGNDTVKTPMEMFSDYEIDNDLKMVDNEIRKYYEIEIKGEENND
jgi:hypothetical protein